MRRILVSVLVILLFVIGFSTIIQVVDAKGLILGPSTEMLDIYGDLYVLYDNEQLLSIEDVVSQESTNKFVLFDHINQKSGYFTSTRWLRFDVTNESDENKWILEFAFPLIYQIDLYEIDQYGETTYRSIGSDYPFFDREITHRYFGLELAIDKGATKRYYVRVLGGGDLYPPISIWHKQEYIDKNLFEIALLGLFYGMIFVMVVYNFFLFIALRMRSYLYYVLTICTVLIANLSGDGFAFQYLWPNSPEWNAHSAIFFVTLSCIFLLLFTRTFLDTDIFIPNFKYFVYIFIAMNILTLISLFYSRNIASNFMTLSALASFLAVLTVGFISLLRGARQARFFVIGWVIFLLGVSITILERIAIIPYSTMTEYAGQMTFAIEVMLLSFALADKINIMRLEKSQAIRNAIQSQKIAMESLQKADELKDDFLAVTSHELKTPLYGMIGIAESLRDGVTGEVSDDTKEQLEVIVTSGNRLTDLVNDILDFTKIQNETLTLTWKPVHLFGLIKAIFTICQPLIKDKQIKLVNKVPTSFPSIYADQNRLQQILYNLIGNAIKYTNEGEVSITVEEIGSEVKISVRDTGQGISKLQQKEIFKPFAQGNASSTREASGTGIGLNITSELIRLHGGKLELDSTLGVGTTFSFTLPIASNEKNNLAIDEIAVTLNPIKHHNKLITPTEVISVNHKATIIVADDEIVNLQVLTNQLYLEGYEVITASTGNEVLTLVNKHEVDLVILDIMMPQISGYEVCERLRKKYSLMELPILMLTAKNQTQDRIMAFELGANDYLAKPCDKSELISRVKTLVKLKGLNQELFIMNLELEEMVKKRTFELENANSDLNKLNDNLIAMAHSRRQLLANIAHELGTPVMMVHSYLQALQEGLIESSNQYYNEIVFEKINLLNRLISDLSDLSQLGEGQASLNTKRVSLYEWLDHTCKKIKFDTIRLERKFKIVNIPPIKSNFVCHLDTIRMDQVFTNLISNAVKNTDKSDGEISIEVSMNETKDLVTIHFSDNGFGIEKQQLPYLFERFYKAPQSLSSDKVKGTGLGLAIVKEIVHGHHGKIEVESELHVGTTFFLTLPIQKIK